MPLFTIIRVAAFFSALMLITSCAWLNGSTGATSTREGLLVAGHEHTCAIRGDGKVKCWGRNNLGQLGGGTSPQTSVAQTVPNLADARFLAAGNSHSCAVRTNGQIRCWGNNGAGQLGGGSKSVYSGPVDVAGVFGAIAVAAGESHTCALQDDGAVLCWGANERGQLGNGANAPSVAPVRVIGISTATAIIAGAEYNCALVENGEVRCWGRNDQGQLGNGNTTDSNSPVAVKNLINADGTDHICVELSDTTIQCAARLSAGSGSDSGANHRYVRTGGVAALANLTNATSLRSYWSGACAKFRDGSSQCWSLLSSESFPWFGYPAGTLSQWWTDANQDINESTNFGTCKIVNGIKLTCEAPSEAKGDDAASRADLFAGTIGIGSWSLVATAGDCAMTDNLRVLCWGEDPFGKNGNSALVDPLASRVPGIVDVTSISASQDHTCVSTLSGQVACWGQLPSLPYQYLPVVAPSPSPTFVGEIDSAIAVHTTPFFDCASTPIGWAQCWPGSASNVVADMLAHPVLIGEVARVEQVSSNCVLALEKVWCRNTPYDGDWNGTAGFIGKFSQVPLPAPAIKINSRYDTTCVLLKTGRINCIERSHSESDAPETISYASIEIAGIQHAVTISDNCAFTESGEILCWKFNEYGLNRREIFVNNPAPSITDAVDIAISGGHSCALHRNGTVSCWGYNYSGELGNGTFERSEVPVLVKGVEHAKKIVAGSSHTCALLTDNTVTCWGSNRFGQRGNGEKTSNFAPLWVKGID